MGITAEWARKEATAVLGEKVQKEIELCDTAIKNAVKVNKFSINVFQRLDTLTKKDLVGRGFVLTDYPAQDQRDSSYIKVEW